jgi:3'(2'), 5'-bisphosphate nucleotidase
MQQPTDAALAAWLAEQAGRLLLDVRRDKAQSSAQERKDAGDQRAHDWLVKELSRARPNDVVLSEEGKDDRARLSADRVWIVDPLDGTREFSELGRDDWAVHVALWEARALTVGAVALPAQSTTLSTQAPAALGALRDGPPRLLVSRTRPPQWVTPLADLLGAEMVAMGSAGAKAIAVVRGEAEIYVHAGGQYEWDSAAPVAVARAVGLHASRIDGSPLEYNRPDPLLPDVLICRAELRDQVLDLLTKVTRTP